MIKLVVGSYFKSKMSEKFSLKWIDFHSNVSKSFGLFRNEDYLHDVTLVSDDHKQVSAHKLVLSACSGYFKEIFKNNNKPNAHTLLCLDGISANDLQNIMDYIYKGEVLICEENLERFLSVAQRLTLDGLIANNEGDFQKYYYKEDKQLPKEEYISDEESSESNNPSHQNASSVVDKVKVPQSNVDMTNYIVDVNQHIEKVSGGAFTIFKCKLCGKEGKKSIDMQRHIETHLEGLSYSCQLCRKTFRSRNSLRTHRTQFHK